MKTKLIKELEQVVERIEEELEVANINLENAKLKRVERIHGVKIGSIVISEEKEYKVASIDVGWGDKPWLKGYGLNKNGKWSKSTRNLYDDWELKKDDLL